MCDISSLRVKWLRARRLATGELHHDITPLCAGCVFMFVSNQNLKSMSRNETQMAAAAIVYSS